MKKSWDAALRSLARRTSGPFRALAYGVTATAAGVPTLREELVRLLREQGLSPESERVADCADPASGAWSRPVFHSGVLDWIVGSRSSDPIATPSKAMAGGAEARLRLRSVAAELGRFLDSLAPDPDLAATPISAPEPLPEPVPPAAPKETPLVVVRRFEDLGSDAEAIGAAVEAIVCRGAHLLLAMEDLDTRVREGRAAAALVLRLGAIKAAQSRERSLQELGRRRHGLEVYGPVPFGFAREGRKLVPVPSQLETVTKVKDWTARGLSLFDVALGLNREGRAWKDGTTWTPRRVQRILQNPIYDLPRREDIA